jgi:hypothetical protein
MGTIEFFYDSKGLDCEGLIFLEIVSLLSIVPVVGIGTAIFFATKSILARTASNSISAWRWLSVPAWIFALCVIVYGVWNTMPQQRLTRVCRGTSITAQNIKVVGCTGMQMGQWLAVFETKEDDFQKLVRKQQLQPTSAASFTDELEHANMLHRTGLFANLSIATNAQCFKRNYIGVDGHLHGGIYAAFDLKTSRGVVLRQGY